MNRFSREVYRPIPEVDPDILKAMKMVGTIGYAPNIGNKKRNIINYSLKRSNEKVGTIVRTCTGTYDAEEYGTANNTVKVKAELRGVHIFISPNTVTVATCNSLFRGV
jgi:hypothetical protein